MLLLRRLLLLIATATAVSAESPSALTVLETRCLPCHSGKSPKGSLDLSTRDSLVRGGGRGSAVVSGDAKSSLLFQLVTHAKEPYMPFGSPKLTDAEVDALAAWIDHGMPFPQTPPQAAKAPILLKSDHWAFQLPTRPPVPRVENDASVSNPIDAFLEAERVKRGLVSLPVAE